VHAQDPRLIALVAARYRELQGLLTMVDAVLPLYLGAMLMLAGRFDAVAVRPWVLVGAAVPLLAFVAARFRWLQPRIQAYYRLRFGRVQGLYPSAGTNMMSQGLILAAILADARLPWLTVIAVLATVGAWPAWIAWRDWPYRWHWLPAVGVSVLTAGSMSLMPSYAAALRHLAAWALSIGVSLAVAGLGDHLLLVRSLGRASDSPVPDEA
jgi:hypothetical protein